MGKQWEDEMGGNPNINPPLICTFGALKEENET
jgi:hypothetical protein